MSARLGLLGRLLLLWILASPACAGDLLQVSAAWVREAPPAATVHAAYMTLLNPGGSSVWIESVSSTDFAAAEIHRSRVEDGIARMQPVARLEIPAGGRLALEPGSYHLMLFNAARPLRTGDTVTLLLHLADGPCIRVSAPVRREIDAGQPAP